MSFCCKGVCIRYKAKKPTCMSIGKAGAKNAAILAAQILAINDSALKTKLEKQRLDKQKSLKKADDKLRSSK